MATTPTPMPATAESKPKRKMTPAEQAMVQEAQDAKDSKAAGAAYDKASPAPYKKGGSVSSRADGCAVKGKTRGKMM